MKDAVIWLVYGYDDYEDPCDPVKAFRSESAARAFLAYVSEYHAKRPECPVNVNKDMTDEELFEFEKWSAEIDKPWEKGHPAGESQCYHVGFCMKPIDFSEES